MCMMSIVTGYGQRMRQDWWDQSRYNEFLNALRVAKQFDDNTGQPDCVAPEKEKFLADLERRMREEVTG